MLIDLYDYRLTTNNVTQLINSQNYFTNKQLEDILSLMDRKYRPKRIVIVESKKEMIRLIKYIGLRLMDITIWLGNVEGAYSPSVDTIFIYVFSQTDEDDHHSKQLYSLHALFHELRHRWQLRTKIYMTNEDDADKFATSFINTNSESISEIMNWEDEWEVEE